MFNFQVLLLCVIIAVCNAAGLYGGGGYGGGGYGGSNYGPITAAVQTKRTVEVRPVASHSEPIQPQIIEVPAEELPVHVHFKSVSSRVLVQQTHIPGISHI